MFSVQDLVVVLEMLVRCCFLAELVGRCCVSTLLPGVVALVIEIGHAPKELAGMAVGGLEGFASEFGHFDGHVEVGLAHAFPSAATFSINKAFIDENYFSKVVLVIKQL